MKLSNELLYQFALSHDLIGMKQAKSRQLLLKEFFAMMKNMTTEEFERCHSITIRNREYQKKELQYLAILVKDMHQYNDFCNGEFLTKGELPSPNLAFLFDQAMKFPTLEAFLASYKESEKKNLLDLLETYRTYYATPKEKEKYDNFRRQSDYLYRKTPLFVGYEAFNAYLEKKNNPTAVEQFLTRNHLPKSVPIQRYIAKYLPYASKIELQEYKSVCSNVLLESRSTILLKKWYQWLTSIDIKEMPNYEQQFLENENISSRLFRIIILSNKQCDDVAYQKLYQKVIELEEFYQDINAKRKEKEMKTLLSYLTNNQSYLFIGEPFNVLDFFSLTVFPYNEIRQDGYFHDKIFRHLPPYRKLYATLLAVQPKSYQEKRPYFITKREDISDIDTIKLTNDEDYLLNDLEKDAIWNYIEEIVLPRTFNLKTYYEIAKELITHPNYFEEFKTPIKKR